MINENALYCIGCLIIADTRPQPIINRLENEIPCIAKESGVIEKLAAVGVEAISTSQAQFIEIIRKEQGIYAEAVWAAGLKRN